MRVFMVRSRKLGVLTSHVFANPPNATQMAALVPEDEGAGWPRVHVAELLSGEQLPTAPAPEAFSVPSTGLPEITMSAAGVVTPKA